MMRQFVMGCVFILMVGVPVEAVSLRVETARGDSVFFAAAGDTLSVSVRVDSEGQVLTGVEVFLAFDPRFYAVADTLRPSLLFGRILIDTVRTFSDSVSVLHFAEADFVGKSVAGVLFEATFLVRTEGPLPDIGLLSDPTTYRSVYTIDSDAGEIFGFESQSAIRYQDLPPVLKLPPFWASREDESFVIALVPLVSDEEPGSRLRWTVTSKSDRITSVVTDSLTVVLTPDHNFSGQAVILISVTDGAGGRAQGEVVLNVSSVNDLPVVIAGALPDSLVLSQTSERINLVGAAQDAEGDSLVWSARGTSDVTVVIESNRTALVAAPFGWSGEATVLLFVSDGFADGAPHGIRIYRAEALTRLPGDIDGDGEVGFSDFLLFAREFGMRDVLLRSDLNGDGAVDFPDFLILVENFGRKS